MPSPAMARLPLPAIAPDRASSERVASTVSVVAAPRLPLLARARRPLLEAARVALPLVRTTAVPRAESRLATVSLPALRLMVPLRVFAAASVRLLLLYFQSVPPPEITPSRATSAAWLMFRV